MAHGKRRTPYRIELASGATHTTNAKQYAQALASGWIVPVKDKLARIADGVRAVLVDGVLRLESAARRGYYFIRTSWAAIDRLGPIQGEYWHRAIQREHCGPRVVVVDSGLPWWERCPGPIEG